MSGSRQETRGIAAAGAASADAAAVGRRRSGLDRPQGRRSVRMQQIDRRSSTAAIGDGGFERALHRKRRELPPRPKKLNGRQEAEILALSMSTPPAGCGSWSLRLIADRAVELEIVDSISHETIRQTLTKRHADRSEDAAMGDSAERERRVRGSDGSRSGHVRAPLHHLPSGGVHG